LGVFVPWRSARRLTVLLMFYLTADLSNPWMPGAFVFDADESVEAIAGHRANVERPGIASVRIRSNVDEVPPPSELSRPERRHAVVRLAYGEWLVEFRRVHAQAHEFRSPTEDH
jgi:hypothetical protein